MRQRQKILSVADMSKMRVNAKVREATNRPDQTWDEARVRVNASDSIMEGRVTEVSPLPDGDESPAIPPSRRSTPPRSRSAARCRSCARMYATVDILIDERDNVLTVPVQAVASYLGKDQVAVRIPKVRLSGET